MSSNSIHIDELHAYADGRLPAARRAAVEAYLAAHPVAAAEVAVAIAYEKLGLTDRDRGSGEWPVLVLSS